MLSNGIGLVEMAGPWKNEANIAVFRYWYSEVVYRLMQMWMHLAASSVTGEDFIVNKSPYKNKQ